MPGLILIILAKVKNESAPYTVFTAYDHFAFQYLFGTFARIPSLKTHGE